MGQFVDGKARNEDGVGMECEQELDMGPLAGVKIGLRRGRWCRLVCGRLERRRGGCRPEELC
jgi:hypothetical protein